MGKALKDTLNLRYHLVPNTLEGVGGYRRVITHLGSVDESAIFENVAAALPGVSAAVVGLIWDSLLEVVEGHLVKYQYRVTVCGTMFELAIPGSTDSINGMPTGGVYVAIRPSAAMRTAVAGISPIYSADDEDEPKVKSVENLANHRTDEIEGTGQFRLAVNNGTASGDDESIVVVAVDGTETVAEVDSEDGLGMFITAHLPVALPQGKGKVLLKTHGKRTPEGELRQCVKSVTIVAGETPPEPVGIPSITSAKSTGYANCTVNIGGGDLTVEGENLATATEVKFLDPDGSEFYTVPVTYADGKLVAAEGTVRTEGPASGSVKVTTAGGTATLDVTFTTP